ncbi:hypothetical protein BDW69DRAFT_193447 [Aspergillus filifer]
MYSHSGLLDLYRAEESTWVDRVIATRVDGSICAWISTFHPDKLPCQIGVGFMNGSYNLCQEFVYEDNTAGVLRLPRVFSIRREYAEKILVEVEAPSMIREKTDIPDNPLDLGPFILMDFIDGVSLFDVFGDRQSRLLKDDIMLQLYQINFDHISSFPTRKTGARIPIRPLTLKAHGIHHEGGVDTFGDRSEDFNTVTEYLEYSLRKDEHQLKSQVNSAIGRFSVREAYATLDILRSLMRDLVHSHCDRGPYKLIYDDFGLGNMIVKSRDDPTIVGVIDFEWVYAGPAQVFASGPWWLLGEPPTNYGWNDTEEREPPHMASRYFKYLEIFKTREEGKSISTLMDWSEASGAMWLHMILAGCFIDSLSFPCEQLKRHRGMKAWMDTTVKLENTE